MHDDLGSGLEVVESPFENCQMTENSDCQGHLLGLAGTQPLAWSHVLARSVKSESEGNGGFSVVLADGTAVEGPLRPVVLCCSR